MLARAPLILRGDPKAPLPVCGGLDFFISPLPNAPVLYVWGVPRGGSSLFVSTALKLVSARYAELWCTVHGCKGGESCG